MKKFCEIPVEYDRRVKAPEGSVVHAGHQSRERTACGIWIHIQEGVTGRRYYHGTELPKTEKITCGNCLRVLAADDAAEESNSNVVYAIRSKDGLYLTSAWPEKFSTSIARAALYKKHENAVGKASVPVLGSDGRILYEQPNIPMTEMADNLEIIPVRLVIDEC